jgi:hypothetical protein
VVHSSRNRYIKFQSLISSIGVRRKSVLSIHVPDFDRRYGPPATSGWPSLRKVKMHVSIMCNLELCEIQLERHGAPYGRLCRKQEQVEELRRKLDELGESLSDNA